MKILLVGATGTVGSAVRDGLTARGHDVIAAHRSSPEWPVDLADPAQIERLLDKAGTVDAIACTAGTTPFGPWDGLDRDAWRAGLDSKLLGQVELVRRGTAHVREGGSFTLITGVLAREPIRGGAIAAAVNGALEAWVRASALELQGRFRINAVSPTVLTESLDVYDESFPGFPTVPAADVARAYARSIESFETGRVYLL
ncbi:short chain dehydrogenase [Glycomyces endophyticus]|uniref:Short chain dehydrogenase n=1 Tax=Glycomyces endophyticus TaxID=480996 RepID=A0ABP4TY90_9ACTN